MMKTPFGFRLWALIVALLLVAGGTIYGLFSAWQRIQLVESKLTTSQFERFQLASTVRHELQNLNSSMLRYTLLRDPAEWTHFDKASDLLNSWIDTNDPSMNTNSLLSTAQERELFEELNRDYDNYLDAARAVYSNDQPAMVTSQQLAQLDAFDKQADHMRELVRGLSVAHREAEASFLKETTAPLDSLRGMLIAGVVTLLALVGAMGIVIYRDTVAPLQTRLVSTQMLLEKQEKLATLGTLAAGIAHEVRNPLTSLKARLYTLEKHLHAVPAAKKDTDIISAEISRLERIVRDVLSFARPSEPELETIRADTIINEVRGLMSPDLERRGVRLMAECGQDLEIRADTGHLKQVLVNLVRNASEAIEGAGTVTMRARAGSARLKGRETSAVILEVSDTGRGIPPDVEKRLFDPFFTTKETGTGLGLPIAARIVEKHGGMLQYQTRPGHGTTFGVVLAREMNDTGRSANSTKSSAH